MILPVPEVLVSCLFWHVRTAARRWKLGALAVQAVLRLRETIHSPTSPGSRRNSGLAIRSGGKTMGNTPVFLIVYCCFMLFFHVFYCCLLLLLRFGNVSASLSYRCLVMPRLQGEGAGERAQRFASGGHRSGSNRRLRYVFNMSWSELSMFFPLKKKKNYGWSSWIKSLIKEIKVKDDFMVPDQNEWYNQQVQVHLLGLLQKLPKDTGLVESWRRGFWKGWVSCWCSVELTLTLETMDVLWLSFGLCIYRLDSCWKCVVCVTTSNWLSF